MNAPLLITLLTDNLYSMISEYKVVHDGDNLSDHSVLQMVLQLRVEYINESGVANRQCDRPIQCAYGSVSSFTTIPIHYRLFIGSCPCTSTDCGSLARIQLAPLKACMTVLLTRASKRAMLRYHDAINVNALRPLFGWNEHVPEQRERAIFWHFIWKQCGSPFNGVVAGVRRYCRAKYH